MPLQIPHFLLNGEPIGPITIPAGHVLLGKSPLDRNRPTAGAPQANSAETPSDRVIAASDSQGRLSESVGAGYIELNWPSQSPAGVSQPGLDESGHGGEQTGPMAALGAASKILRVEGTVPPEAWNRLGSRLIPQLRRGSGLTIRVEFDVAVDGDMALGLETDLRRVLDELGLSGDVSVTQTPLPEPGRLAGDLT